MDEGLLTRIPSFSRYIKIQKENKVSTGQLTIDTIEEARQELKEQKAKLSNQEYDD
jgi:type II secretory pathway component PulF